MTTRCRRRHWRRCCRWRVAVEIVWYTIKAFVISKEKPSMWSGFYFILFSPSFLPSSSSTSTSAAAAAAAAAAAISVAVAEDRRAYLCLGLIPRPAHSTEFIHTFPPNERVTKSSRVRMRKMNILSMDAYKVRDQCPSTALVSSHCLCIPPVCGHYIL